MVAPPLLLTDDETLVGAVGRLAAAAGTDLVIEREPGRLGVTWSAAAAVLVGADLAAATSLASPPRRQRVHVLCPGPAPDAVFRDAVALGAAAVLELPEAEAWLAELLADLADLADLDALEVRAALGVSVAVVGGSGGAGASTLAAALAVRAARSGADSPEQHVALLDLDPLGPGLRRVLGSDEPGGVTWPELADLRGRLGGRALRTSLGGPGTLGVLGWSDDGAPRAAPTPALLREVVAAARRGHAWVVLDVPRHLCAPLAPTLAADHWVLVSHAGVAAVASASTVAATLREQGARLHLVVRERGGGADPVAVARLLGVPLAATLGRHRRLDEHLDLGLGPLHGRRNPLAHAAAEVLGAVSAGERVR